MGPKEAWTLLFSDSFNRILQGFPRMTSLQQVEELIEAGLHRFYLSRHNRWSSLLLFQSSITGEIHVMVLVHLPFQEVFQLFFLLDADGLSLLGDDILGGFQGHKDAISTFFSSRASLIVVCTLAVSCVVTGKSPGCCFKRN